jgi:hypothetical protein
MKPNHPREWDIQRFLLEIIGFGIVSQQTLISRREYMIKKIGLAMLMIFLSFGMARSEEKQVLPKHYFGVIAEGVSSPNSSEGIDAGTRMWTLVEQNCPNRPKVKKLVIYNKLPIILHVGKAFSMMDLRIVAFDTHNRPIESAPLIINIENTAPVDAGPTMTGDGNIMPEHTGYFRWEVDDMCGGASVFFGSRIMK